MPAFLGVKWSLPPLFTPELASLMKPSSLEYVSESYEGLIKPEC